MLICLAAMFNPSQKLVSEFSVTIAKALAKVRVSEEELENIKLKSASDS